MNTEDIVVRRAVAGDVPGVIDALAALADDLGDPFTATADTLEAAAFADPPAAFIWVAEGADGRLLGVALAAPVMSTVAGCLGLYVSDLWVSETARNAGLGRRLLDAAVRGAPAQWRVGFLRLAVHDHNARAARFYARLGFEPVTGERLLRLDRADFHRLTDPT